MSEALLEDNMTRDRSRAIGSILVLQGRLSAAEVEKICLFAASTGLRFGEAALRLQMLSEKDVDMAIAQQFSELSPRPRAAESCGPIRSTPSPTR